uniref:Uncharacterized protein n=1 Tax=Heterosigma akashiwo TaxID=2829 RepID=A0A6V1TR22_HETAK
MRISMDADTLDELCSAYTVAKRAEQIVELEMIAYQLREERCLQDAGHTIEGTVETGKDPDDLSGQDGHDNKKESSFSFNGQLRYPPSSLRRNILVSPCAETVLTDFQPNNGWGFDRRKSNPEDQKQHPLQVQNENSWTKYLLHLATSYLYRIIERTKMMTT